METITIKYNPADALALSAIQLLQRIKSIKVVKPNEEIVPNDETLKAVEDIKKGKVYHAKNTEELFQQILG